MNDAEIQRSVSVSRRIVGCSPVATLSFQSVGHTVYNIIYMSVNGSDSHLCITSNSVDYPCETVSFAIDNVESSTQIEVLRLQSLEH